MNPGRFFRHFRLRGVQRRVVLIVSGVLLVIHGAGSVWVGTSTRRQVLDQARESTLVAGRMIQTSLLRFMRSPDHALQGYVDRVRSLPSVRGLEIVRGEAILRQFGPGAETQDGAFGRETMSEGREIAALDESRGEPILHQGFPIRFESGCLQCHTGGRVGDTAGAVVLATSVASADARGKGFIATLAGFSVVNVAFLSLLLFVLVRQLVLRPIDRVVAIVGETVGRIEDSAQDQVTSATQLGAGMQEQAATSNEVAAAAREIARHADLVQKAAAEAVAAAEAGRQSLVDAAGGMERIEERTQAVADRILRLSELVGQIQRVTGLIGGVADRSDLLALNAAVEGARAGDAGRGFGVVAGEMRRLAEHVSQSAKEIGDLVTEVQRSTHAAVLSTEEDQKAVREGKRVVASASERFDEIVSRARGSATAGGQIADATQQQSTASEQMAGAIHEMGAGSETVLSVARSFDEWVHRLRAVSDDLKALVGLDAEAPPAADPPGGPRGPRARA